MTINRRSFELLRPTLLGAVLIKARSLTVHSDPESQREDLLTLLAAIEDPRRSASELRASERRWLRAAAERLDFPRISSHDSPTMRRAELAFRLLIVQP